MLNQSLSKKRKSYEVLTKALMLLSFSAYAETTSRASNFFVETGTYIDKVSGTTFEVWFEVMAKGLMDELGVSTIKIERSSDGTNWMTMKTYSMSNYSQMIDEDTGWHGSYVTYTGSYGYYYRAKVTFYAKNASGTGTYTMYTSTVMVP